MTTPATPDTTPVANPFANFPTPAQVNQYTPAAPPPPTPTVPVYDPDGKLRAIPQDQLLDAVHNHGGIPAMKFQAPDKSIRYVPANRVQEAVQARGTPLPDHQQDVPQNLWDQLKNIDWAHAARTAASNLNPVAMYRQLAAPDPLADPFHHFTDEEQSRAVAESEARAAATNAQRENMPGLPAWYPGKAYSWLSSAAEMGGVPVSGMEQSAQQGDTSGIVGHAITFPAQIGAAEGLAALHDMPVSKLTAPVRKLAKAANVGLERAPEAIGGTIGGGIGAGIGYKVGGYRGAELGGPAGAYLGHEAAKILPKMRVPGESFGLPSRVTGGPEVAPPFQPPPVTPPVYPGAPYPETPSPALLQAGSLQRGPQTVTDPAAGLGQVPQSVVPPFVRNPGAPFPATPSPELTQAASLSRGVQPVVDPAGGLGGIPVRPSAAGSIVESVTAPEAPPKPPISKAELARKLDVALPQSMGLEPPTPAPGQPIFNRPKPAAPAGGAAAPIPELTPVEGSSAVEGYHYDPDAREFYYKERSNGITYVYGDIGPEAAKTFEDAKSKGKALGDIRRQSGAPPVAKIINGQRVSVRPTAQAGPPQATSVWRAPWEVGQTPTPSPESAPEGTGTPAQGAPENEPLFAGRSAVKKAHGDAVGQMLMGASAPPETMDWNVVRPGKGLPNALQLNDTARELVGHSMNAQFGGASVSPATLDQEVLPRLEMAAQAIDRTRAQRPDYFDPQASAKVRELAQAIQDNRGPEGVSFTRSEGTPEQQRYTTHEELFHTAVQRRPAGEGGLMVPDLSDDPGMEKMRPRIIQETGRLTSIVHHAEGMADIMQGRAPELTPEEAGNTAQNYWTQLAARGKVGVQALVDAFKLENYMDDDQVRGGYTLDENTNAIRTAGRNALARVLTRHFGEDLRGLARAVREEPERANLPSAAGGANAANVPEATTGQANLRSPAENPAGQGAGPSGEVEQPLLTPDERSRISTRRPTGVTSTEDPMKQDLQVNTQAIRDAGLEENMAARIRDYVGQKLSGTPSEILNGFKKHLTDNLVWLHNQLPENFRAMSKQWYDGANKLAGDWSKQYSTDDQQVSKPQVAGVIASLSPQKDWHMNVSLAQRVVETYLQHQDTAFSPEMKAASRRLASTTESLRPYLKEIAGKKLSDLTDPVDKAMWVRLYDEAHNSRSYNVYAPDGSVSDVARNQDGSPSKVAWGSNEMTAKAISILEDGSRQNISDQLGDMHKVRNFYNNIIAPNSKAGDVTIDTHAVAAAHLRPLAGGDIEVLHNFGGTPKGVEGVGQSKIAGVKGSYGLYADAYRAAAEKLGVLPRELQSMTWEGIRSLFPAEYKTEANKAIINGIWSDYQNGKLTLGQARRQVVKAAGGFKSPEWARGSRTGVDEAPRSAAEPEDVSGGGIHGQPPGPALSRGGSRAARAVPESVKSSPSPVPPFLKRAARANVSQR